MEGGTEEQAGKASQPYNCYRGDLCKVRANLSKESRRASWKRKHLSSGTPGQQERLQAEVMEGVREHGASGEIQGRSERGSARGQAEVGKNAAGPGQDAKAPRGPNGFLLEEPLKNF